MSTDINTNPRLAGYLPPTSDGRCIQACRPLAVLAIHAGWGYLLILIGLAAMLLRLPCLARWRWLHGRLGLTWALGTYFMAVTAISLADPRTTTMPDTVYIFIHTMYITLVLGQICIKVWQWLQRRAEQDKVGPESSVAELEGGARACAQCRARWLVWLHGLLMVYAWVMLLGAGIAFTTSMFERSDELINPDVGQCVQRRMW